MLYPTVITAALAVLIIAGLGAVDWYVWAKAAKGYPRGARLVRPLSMRELATRILGGVAATNGEVLMVPPVVAPDSAKAIAAEKEHHAHGFKKVA